jgi:hypothetical protein
MERGELAVRRAQARRAESRGAEWDPQREPTNRMNAEKQFLGLNSRSCVVTAMAIER